LTAPPTTRPRLPAEVPHTRAHTQATTATQQQRKRTSTSSKTVDIERFFRKVDLCADGMSDAHGVTDPHAVNLARW
jgi:hypothetical protein